MVRGRSACSCPLVRFIFPRDCVEFLSCYVVLAIRREGEALFISEASCLKWKHLVNASTQPPFKLAVVNEWILLQDLVRLSLVCAVGRITVWALINGLETKVLLSRLVLDQVLTTLVEMLHVSNKSF